MYGLDEPRIVNCKRGTICMQQTDPTQPESQLLTVAETAARLRISRGALYERFVSRRKLEKRKIGSRTFFLESDVNRLILALGDEGSA